MVQVPVTEVIRTTAPCHYLVEGVDTLHVVHGPEREVCSHPGGSVHIPSDSLMEVPCGILRALGTTVEVLAGIFRDPDGLAEAVMEFIDVLNKRLRVHIIPVNRYTIKSAASSASTQKLLDPCIARGSRGGSGRDKIITLILQRLDILLP